MCSVLCSVSVWSIVRCVTTGLAFNLSATTFVSDKFPYPRIYPIQLDHSLTSCLGTVQFRWKHTHSNTCWWCDRISDFGWGTRMLVRCFYTQPLRRVTSGCRGNWKCYKSSKIYQYVVRARSLPYSRWLITLISGTRPLTSPRHALLVSSSRARCRNSFVNVSVSKQLQKNKLRRIIKLTTYRLLVKWLKRC